MAEDLGDRLTQRWRLVVALIWISMAAVLIYQRWGAISWFGLGDTDDNLRMAQVRALLAGQDWFDLRQYKLNPPFGADVHWSRLVDLPIAGIKLALTPLTGGALAEKIAVTLAPLLPMLVALYAMAATVRKLIDPKTFALGAAILLCAASARGMWMPLRIDHHGWQLALLAIALLGVTETRPARGGALLGIATALSFAIGLEMLLYLAMAGGVTGLRWVHDRAQAPRLAAYGASLAGGCALGYLLFASNANRMPVCDAFSPVWLSVMTVAGALALVLARVRIERRWARFGAAAAAVAILAAVYVIAWPHCLGWLEGASPELRELWLSRVREALPVYAHSWKIIFTIVSLPLVGMAGYALMLWRSRADGAKLVQWVGPAAMAFFSVALLTWQTRVGAAAQLLAAPGAAGLAWLLIGRFQQRRQILVRTVGTVAAFALASGIAFEFAARLIPDARKAQRGSEAVGLANRRCPTLPALRAVALQPAGTVLTHVDLGPRLITVTPHKAIAGPYHRNGDDIIAVMRAFRGSADNARATVIERRVDYVLICPNLSETTIYRAEAPKGFYVQLMRGQVPAWLEPVDLGNQSPYRMWRVKR